MQAFQPSIVRAISTVERDDKTIEVVDIERLHRPVLETIEITDAKEQGKLKVGQIVRRKVEIMTSVPATSVDVDAINA